MPTIGGVYVPDNLMPKIAVPDTPRPGMGAVFGSALKSAYGQVRYGVPYDIGVLSGGLSQGREQELKAGLAQADAAANVAPPASLSDLTSGKVGIGRFIGENFAASLPQTASILAGGIVGGLAGGEPGVVAGTLAAGTPQFIGSNVDRAVQESGGLSRAAAVRSTLAAPVQAASDALVERYMPGVGHAFGDLAATQTGGFLARTAKSIVKAGATEAVAEAGQQLGERAAAGLPVTGPDAAAEYVNAAVTAFAVGGTLGAGGGFRRTPALAKPADSVTNDEMSQRVDGMLDGSLRGPAPLALPAPADIIGTAGGPGQVNPAGTTQLALPSPDMFRGPDVVTDARGVSALNPGAENALTIDRNQPRTPFQPSQELTDFLAQFGRPGPQAPLGSQASTAAIMAAQGAPGGVQSRVEAPASRPFVDQPIADIATALSAKDAPDDIKSAAQAEIQARRDEAVGKAPLTTDNFQTRVEDLKHGLRGGWVQKLEATDPQDLLGKVYSEVFDNQNTASNVAKLAQRVGLLDDKLNPTPLATQMEAERTAATRAEATPQAAAPVVDPAFAQQWEQIKADAGISRLRSAKDLVATPANIDDARAQVITALANDKSNAAVSQTEKVAQKLGLITNDDARDVTPLGRQAFLGTPAGVEAVASAAKDQGYSGDQQDIFTRGVQAQLAGTEAADGLSSFPDLAAYQAGKTFAEKFVQHGDVKSAAASDVIRQRQDQRSTAQAVERAKVAKRELSADQIRQQSLNRLLDAADTSTLDDSARATLRRMVRDGATPEEVGNALQQAQGGQSLFTQPEATPHTLVGEKPARGQPIFREMNQPTAPTAQRAQNRTETSAAVRAYNVRNAIDYATEQGHMTAARAAKLHELVDNGNVDQADRLVKIIDAANTVGRAIDEGGLDGRANTRAQAAFLDRFNNGEAVDNLRYGEPSAATSAHPVDQQATPFRVPGLASGQGMTEREESRARKAFWQQKLADQGDLSVAKPGYGDASSQFEQFVGGKDFAGAAAHMVDHAPSPAIRAVMTGVRDLTKRLAKLGHTFEFHVVRDAADLPAGMTATSRAYATTSLDPTKPGVSKVFLKSADVAGGGFNYYIAAHEMVHAATMSAIRYARATDPFRRTDLGKAVGALDDLQNAVRDHLQARIASGEALSPFEQSYKDRDTNVFQDADELIAWGLTSPEAQQYLQSIEYKPTMSVFGKLVQLVRGLLGIDGKYDNALTELLGVSESIFGTSDSELGMMARGETFYTNKQFAAASLREGAPRASNDATEALVGGLSAAVDKLNPQDFKVKARRAALGWISHNQLDRLYGRIMPGVLKHSDAKREQGAVRGRFEQMGNEAYQNFERLEREKPEHAARVGKLMALTTEFQIDPDKAFEVHEHLKDDPNITALRRLHGEAVKLKNDLSRGDGSGIKVFNDFRQLNEAQNFARMAAGLHSSIATDPELALGVEDSAINPVDAFMRNPGIDTPEAIRAHWQDALNAQLAAVTTFLRKKKGEVADGTPGEQRAMAQHLSPIEGQVDAIREALNGMRKAPYFHLGRYGDNFGSAVIRKNANGTVDPVAQRKVAEALSAAGFDDVQISTDNTKPRIALRFETVDATMRFKKLMLDLHKQGLLEGGTDEIKAGPRSREDNYGVADGLPEYVQRYIQAIEASPMFVPDENMAPDARAALAKQKLEAVQLARDTWLEQQPDSSISKVLTKRYTVPGYRKDMVRNFAQRWHVGSTSIANVAAQPKLNAAYVDMRSQANEALQGDSKDDPYKLADVLAEIKTRDAKQPINPTADSFDKLRAVAHNYFLGFSPAYGLVNMTQLGVVGLPELAKQHGYSKSFHAMRRASKQAFAIVKAAQLAALELGPKHWADLTITHDVLKNTGLSATERDFVTHMLATGTIDIGSAARALGQVAQGNTGSKLDTAFHYASAIGQYTETFSRLTMALAARDLHGGGLAESTSYANSVVSNSMFDYQNWNTARQLGKQGFAGPITPLLTQFMSYTAQITEKLYSEVLDAAGKQRAGETVAAAAARRAGAQRFLLGHITAVTALAGTLGMPFASVFASVIERLVSSASDQPFDATAAWRDFLAHIFGKPAAEVIARGVPRAFGFDVSQRAGEADLLPFTQLLTDRRDWQSSIESYLGRSIGASPNMLMNIVEGGKQFADGDVLGGAISALPVAFKSPVKAYQMSTEGYMDARGNKLPMTPKASAILWQLMGFTPSDRAEYSEANADQAARRGVLSRQSAQLRSQIVRAMTEGDTAKAHDLVSQAIEFDKANPGFAIVPGLAGAVASQSRNRAQAAALHTPVGVSMRDIAGQRLTDYANVNYAQ